MNIELRRVNKKERETLSNLWEKYDYDFSQYNNHDVNELGLYGCKDLDYYWTKEDTLKYFITVDGKLAGFVMVSNLPVTGAQETDYQIGEFFVMRKYRRLGIGKRVFFRVLDEHKGRWQLVRHPKNAASVYFWDNVVSEYTKGKYQLIKSFPHFSYSDGTLGDLFVFSS